MRLLAPFLVATAVLVPRAMAQSSLPDLGGAAKLRAMDVPVRTLMAFEGH